MIGETIGHFEIIARAGRGGMGEVFVAEHATIKTKVAIKVLHAHVSANTTHVQRFFNEARAVAHIQHAGIVRIFDVGFHTNQRAYLIMEYLEGETLAARLKRAGRIAPREAMEIARQIASILDATHHADIIHRDLKPENVFLVQDRELDSGERVKLLDFGIAKLSDTLAGAGPTTSGAIGTPTYMAPEQWSDASTVDWRADVYSLGCIVYEMAAGQPPFVSKSVAEACAKHLNEAPQPIRRHAPDIAPAVDAFTLRLLAKDRALRIDSTGELERQFTELAAAAPVSSEEFALRQTAEASHNTTVTTLSSAAATSAGPRSGHRLTAAIAGAAVLAAGAIAAWWIAGDGARPAAAPPQPPVATPPPAPGPDAAIAPPAPPPLVGWLEVANPFVAWRGAHWLAHQVTRREYRRFLESLPEREALRFQPVTGWNERDAMRPVAWVTFERAAAFCRAIGAELPASEQWLA
ncbi:MAG TPA: serine/threonine-protein kinase, partial [Kofleriaceae bacterium]|nr:serine/threonine-protein kinase [Kofleriaceae bacterium]